MSKSALDRIESFAVIGVIAGALYLVWQYLVTKASAAGTVTVTDDPCGTMSGLPLILCRLGMWTVGAEPTTKTFDPHGCQEGVTSWCESLKGCVPLGLTCPRPAQPYTPTYTYDEHGCKEGFEQYCQVTQSCLANNLYEDSFCTIHQDEPDPEPKRVGDLCTWGTHALTVPQGKDCTAAFRDMCKRFGPGSWYCEAVA